MLFNSILRNANVTLLFIPNTLAMLYAASPENSMKLSFRGGGTGGTRPPLSECSGSAPVTHGAFCQKCVFGTFWWFSGWIWAKLALICLKRVTRPFTLLATSIAFCDILARACAKIKILRRESNLHL